MASMVACFTEEAGSSHRWSREVAEDNTLIVPGKVLKPATGKKTSSSTSLI
jgi:hypothetical protein